MALRCERSVEPTVHYELVKRSDDVRFGEELLLSLTPSVHGCDDAGSILAALARGRPVGGGKKLHAVRRLEPFSQHQHTIDPVAEFVVGC